MKKLACAILIASAALCSNARDFADWSNFNRYHDSNIEVKALPAAERCVVFLGNSITDNWAGMHPEFFKTNGYIGRGISGQTTYQFLSRFREDVINLHPQIVVINAATNDVAENSHPYNEDMTVGNITSMIELAQANGITVVLTTTLPAAAFPWRKEITDSSEKIMSLNDRLQQLVLEKGITFVDYYSHMVTPGDPSRALNPAYSDDGVHPTPKGYDVMEQIIHPVLRKLLKK